MNFPQKKEIVIKDRKKNPIQNDEAKEYLIRKNSAKGFGHFLHINVTLNGRQKCVCELTKRIRQGILF